MQVKLIQHNDIDYESWDKHISQSTNQLSYAFTWYLDIVSPNWVALITKNYEYIMPLPVKRRYGLPYLVQPILTQQLGIFSKLPIDENIVQQFIKELPSFSYELNLNEDNFHPLAIALPNFILNLNQPYNLISSKYSKNTKRNIEKAIKLKLRVKFDISYVDFFSFYFSVHKNSDTPLQSVLLNLVERGLNEKAMKLYGVFTAENVMVAALCLMHSEKRLTYLMPISNQLGKESSAMFYLIDHIIRHEAEKNKIFDFEGSRIEGVARFYQGFGAINQPYYILKHFRPSFLIRKKNKK
ncbi:MAG: hypothetical protein WC542_08640 [Paludibacter sp.]